MWCGTGLINETFAEWLFDNENGPGRSAPVSSATSILDENNNVISLGDGSRRGSCIPCSGCQKCSAHQAREIEELTRELRWTKEEVKNLRSRLEKLEEKRDREGQRVGMRPIVGSSSYSRSSSEREQNPGRANDGGIRKGASESWNGFMSFSPDGADIITRYYPSWSTVYDCAEASTSAVASLNGPQLTPPGLGRAVYSQAQPARQTRLAASYSDTRPTEPPETIKSRLKQFPLLPVAREFAATKRSGTKTQSRVNMSSVPPRFAKRSSSASTSSMAVTPDSQKSSPSIYRGSSGSSETGSRWSFGRSSLTVRGSDPSVGGSSGIASRSGRMGITQPPRQKFFRRGPQCNFCKNNREHPNVWKSHRTHDPITKKVTCPKIQQLGPCKHCGKYGEEGHTHRRCPTKPWVDLNGNEVPFKGAAAEESNE